MKNEIICFCSMVSKGDIITALKNGARTLDDIRKVTKACTLSDCKNKSPEKICCSKDIIKIINNYNK